jgi:hypothetical protein
VWAFCNEVAAYTHARAAPGIIREGSDMLKTILPRRITFKLAALLVAVVGTAEVLAQASAQPSGGRFTMHPVEGGALRLDTDTGQVSQCRPREGGQWLCQSLPDERAALEKEIERLNGENKELQSAVKRLEELAGLPPEPRSRERHAGKGNDKPEPGFGGMNRLPTEQDVDQVMSYLRGMLKKFKEKLREFDDLDGKQTERL